MTIVRCGSVRDERRRSVATATTRWKDETNASHASAPSAARTAFLAPSAGLLSTEEGTLAG
jgi:hypothetical protein